MPNDATTQLQLWLDAFHEGGASRSDAREHLLGLAYARLRNLAARIGQDFRLPGELSTSVIAQETYLRLRERLDHLSSRDVAGFFRFAAQQIRWMLLDMVRKHRGPQGRGLNEVRFADFGEGAVPEGTDHDTHDPARLVFWQAFHEQVENLPESEREVVELLWYHGLSQPEAAHLLRVPLSTLKHRWRCARLRLQQVLPTYLHDWDHPERAD